MDYWDFEAVADTFLRVPRQGVRVECSRGGLYRLRGRSLTLVRPPEDWLLDHLHSEVDFSVLRSIARMDVPPTVPRRRDGVTWSVDRKAGRSPVVDRAVRRGEREGASLSTPDPEALRRLLGRWVEWAKTRHFMVVRGHYAQMIEDPRYRFIGTFLGGELAGAVGYVVEGDEAAVSFAKTLPGYWWLGKWIWTTGVDEVLGRNPEVRVVRCGDTADRLKREVGMVSTPQYRLRGEGL